MDSATYLLKTCTEGAKSRWQSLRDGMRLLPMKLRRALINRIPPGMRPLVRRLYEKLPRKGGLAARRIRQHRFRMLNLGYLERGYRELAHLAESSRSREIRRRACWELISWHTGQISIEDARKVLSYADMLKRVEWRRGRLIHLATARSTALCTLGNLAEAARSFEDPSLSQSHPDFILARSGLIDELDGRLAAVNQVLQQEKLSAVRLLPGSEPAFDRLTTGLRPEADQSGRPLVSVIVPAYNAQYTIATAIRSLQEQTWRNIEILVVDDCSTDETVSIVTKLANKDSRIQVLRMERNSGAYCARNLGLKNARGKYVTCHDSDDWSHPEKLQIQAEHLERHTDRIVANYSYLYFVDDDLRVRARRLGSYLRLNTSSLMFRREPVLSELGFWDEVRFAADSEFLERLYAVFGRISVISIAKPLSLVRYREDSLTASKAFGYHGFRMGARQFYRERYLRFHRSGLPLRFRGNAQDRPFYVPEPMLPARSPRGARRYFDVVLVLDCRLGGRELRNAVSVLQSYRRQGMSVAVFHLPIFELDPEKPIQEALIAALDAGLFQYVVTGEQVDCEKLQILGWRPLRDYNRFFLDVSAKTIEVTTTRSDIFHKAPTAREREICEATLRRYCDAPVTWRDLRQ